MEKNVNINNIMKKYNTRFLALLLLLGAMLSWTSCKDDDNDSESSKKKISGESSVEDLSEFSESILSDLVTIWCDKDLSDLTTGWTNSTFEPEVGEVLDSEKPYVRGFVVGNVQKADEYAAALYELRKAKGLTEEAAAKLVAGFPVP